MSNIEKIRQEIDGLMKETEDSQFDKGERYGLKTVLEFIDSLSEEKTSEDLEEETEMQWDSFNKHLADYDSESEEVVWLNWNSFKDVANYFAEYGAKHLK